jgi:alkylation response protein AidB-like acyl-CoA dehydrogenase
MVSGAGSGGVDRIGGSGAGRLVRLARTRTESGLPGGWDDPNVRQQIMRLWSDEQIRRWTNLRVRAGRQADRPLGPESSIGKVVQGSLNQAIQLLAVDLVGSAALAWESDADTYGESLPYEVHGMLRSRANTIEGGTTEVNKNILAERVLGLPREPDPWHDRPWSEVPR